MLLPMTVPGAAAHNQPTGDFAPALGTDPVCPDSCVMTWQRETLLGETLSALILVGYGVGGSGPTY